MHRLRHVAEALRHRLRRGERVRAVAAPARLGLVERRAEPDGHEHVLERRARARVDVDVAGGDGGDAEPLGELGEQAVAAAVAAAEGALQLDAQVVGAEGRRAGARLPPLASACLPCSIRFASTPSRAQPRQADEALGVALDRLERNARLGGGPPR